MKKYTTKLSIFIVACLFGFQTNYAQCPNNNTQFGTSNAPNAVGVLTTLSTCLYGGEYRLVNNMVAGSTYSFETCGDSDFDTQITVYDDVTGAFIEFNDDFCGLQSKVQFVSNGNPVRVLIDRYNCANQSSCMTLRVTRVTAAAPVANPCNSITNLTCGSVGTFNFSGTGAWNPPGPWGTPGEEQVFSFTPTVSGTHQVAVANQGGYVDLFAKTGPCGSTGWIYIDDIFSTAQNSLNLTAGVTYLFLIDDENTIASSGAIQITCPAAADPCDDIVDLASCGTTVNYTLATGAGQWDPPGPWGTPGNEAVFSFTPATSGDYDVTVTNDNFYVDLFVKTGTCGPTGWTYVDDIFTTATNSFTLTAGVTYFFLLDDENTTASSGTFTIDCPCVPPAGGIDGTYSYTSPFTISSTTVDACDDCNLRTSEDRIYEINIPCAGSYKFSTCNGATWDTYLYLRTAPCGGSSIALNDDACGLQSEITAQLQPGTYYIHVEGFSSLSQGAFDLNITGILDTPDIGAISGTEQVCENESAVFSVTGSFDSFNWSVPSGASISAGNGTPEVLIDFGSASGIVGVVASNSCGSNSTTYSVLVTPTPEFNISSSAVLCNGGSDGAVELGALVGTAPFTYSLDGSSNSSGVFSGLTAGTYNASAVDANGCSSALVSVTVNEPTVLTASASATDALCFGSCDGSATVSAGGGTPGYSYQWNDPSAQTSATASNLCAGSYSVVVTDANGCSQSVSVTINEPTVLTASAVGTDALCFGSCDGTATVSAGGGTPGYSYQWNDPAGQTSASAAGLCAGSYSVVVTDANGCSQSASVSINEPTVLTSSAVSTDALCNGSCDGTATVSAGGGTAGYSYQWDDPAGQTSASATGLCAGSYNVIVTDANGCTSSSSVTIDEPTPLDLSISGCGVVYTNLGIDYACATIDGVASGGTPGYSYLWSNGESTSSIIVCPDITTTYSLTVTDENGCTITYDWTVEVLDISCEVNGSSSSSSSGSSSGSGSSRFQDQVPNPRGSGSSSSSQSCSLSNYSPINAQGSGSGSSSSGNGCTDPNAVNGNDRVLMCFDGETFCVKISQVQNRLNQGYTLGPCGTVQSAACVNVIPDAGSNSECVCDGKLVTLTVRYIGPSGQDVRVNAKKCSIELLSISGANTGDVFTIDAADAGLSYLRKNTFFEMIGSPFARVKIPTNCCDNPMGRVFFPYEVIGWTDTYGNSCDDSNHSMQFQSNGSEKDLSVEDGDGSMLSQYPNPAENYSTFEFLLTQAQKADVSIWNIRGQLVETIFSGVVEASTINRVEYDLSELQSGIYFVHLTTSSGVLKKKFVILK